MSLLKIDKPIRLIELFAGIGSQAKALKLLNANFEHYRICEFDKYAIKSYNAIHGTNFETSDITKITAEDLEIVDTDKYCYIMTYSFPCQDLSLAGKQKGMAKGEGTRSGLLWEVERLLNECTELPQILLMENVTQVHGKKNIEHFNEWLAYLESKGYKNYWKDLNAKNFCVPQNRNRTFMVSVLGDYTYEFPQEFPLKKRLKDMLEKEVDEKFYISNEKVEKIVNSNFGQEKAMIQKTDVCGTLLARDYKDPKCVEVEPVRLGGLYDDEKGKHQAGAIWDKETIAPTVDTMQGGNRQPLITEEPKVKRLGNVYNEKFTGCSFGGNVWDKNGLAPTLKTTAAASQQFVIEDEPKVIGSIGEKKSNGGRQWYLQDRIYDDNIATSITTAFNPYYKVEEPQERFFKQALETLAENDCSAGDTIDAFNKKVNSSGVSPTITTRPEGFKTAILPVVEPLAYDEQNGYIRKDGTVGTLTTDGSSPKHNNRVIENCYVSEKGVRYICDPQRGMATDINADVCQPLTAKGQANWTGSFVSPDIESLEKSSTIGGAEPTKINLKNGETLTSNDNLSHLRIRKLTPKECWRLMGFQDEDFEKAAEHNSNSQLYKQAGNSICVSVLYYIFKEMM